MKLNQHSRIQGIVQGAIFGIVGLALAAAVGFPYFENVGEIGPVPAALFIVIVLFFTGVLAAVGGIITTRKDYFENKIIIEEADRERASKLGAAKVPYWLSSLFDVIAQLIPFAVLIAVICFGIFGEGLSRPIFSIITAVATGANGFIIAQRVSGRELLKYITNPPGSIPSFPKYVFLEHILGNLLINFPINGAFAYVTYHEGPKHTFSSVKTDDLAIDLLLTCIVVAILVALTSLMEATADAHAGRMAPPISRPRYIPGTAVEFLALAAMGACFWALCYAPLWAFGVKTLTLPWLIIIKGELSAIVAAFAAFFAAYWSILKVQKDKEANTAAA